MWALTSSIQSMLQLKAMSNSATYVLIKPIESLAFYICYVSDFMGSIDLHKRKIIKISATIANGLKHSVCFWLTRVTTAFLQNQGQIKGN